MENQQFYNMGFAKLQQEVRDNPKLIDKIIFEYIKYGKKTEELQKRVDELEHEFMLSLCEPTPPKIGPLTIIHVSKQVKQPANFPNRGSWW